MVKTYHFKWCLRLIVIMVMTTTLTKSDLIVNLRVLDFLKHSLTLGISILACWTTQAYIFNKSQRGITRLTHFTSYLSAWVVLMGINLVFFHYFPHNQLLKDEPQVSEISRMLSLTASCLILTMICYIVLNNVRTYETLKKSELEVALLKQAHLHAQLLSLQQRVSPHFLFNSLSTLTMMTENAEAQEYIVQLSKVYRHLLNFSEHHLTSLKKELEFLESYLYILRIRFEGSLYVTINANKNLIDHLMPPLTLQLLVENAIKHNVLTPDRPLHIHISTPTDSEITVENNFSPKASEPDGLGLGLRNINDRYKLLTNKEISVSADAGNFSVTIPLLSI